MTQCNNLNVKHLIRKLKQAIKNITELTLNLSTNFLGNFTDESNFPYKLLLTNAQLSKIRKTFATGSTANIKFPKIQLTKIVKLGEFLFGLQSKL